MNSTNTIILDGPITKNKDIMNIIASIRKNQKTFKNKKEIGTGLGASMLFNMKKTNKLSLSKIKKTKKYDLLEIYKIWLYTIKKRGLLKSKI